MKQIILAFLTCASLNALPITEDYECALELSKTYQMPLALAFVGSDWAPPCDMLENGANLGNQCIFVKLDFPEVNRQGPRVIARNFALKEEFHVQTFPTVILLSHEGEEITRFGEASTSHLLSALIN